MTLSTQVALWMPLNPPTINRRKTLTKNTLIRPAIQSEMFIIPEIVAMGMPYSKLSELSKSDTARLYRLIDLRNGICVPYVILEHSTLVGFIIALKNKSCNMYSISYGLLETAQGKGIMGRALTQLAEILPNTGLYSVCGAANAANHKMLVGIGYKFTPQVNGTRLIYEKRT